MQSNYKKYKLDHHRRFNFLPYIITCDENRFIMTIDNVKKDWFKSDQPANQIARRRLTNKKFLLCVVWYVCGIEHIEFLKSCQTLNLEIYCEQLKKVDEKVDEKVRKKWLSRRLSNGI
jgi:hypothetical protein